MAFDNRVQLKQYIRFQLAQLSARNAEHEFEHLAFQLARMRVASNLLPATGPVQAGGDQGRDFESYRSYLSASPLGASAFTGQISGGLIAGGCTLEKRVALKIKNDLKTIFGSGERPTHVAYFCEQNVPVAKRHALQAYCRETYGATLDIFDGEGIAELLADRELAWLAEQFLSIPSNAWPQEPVDAYYTSLRERWIAGSRRPQNYADFLDLKLGLRTATFEEAARGDIARWISLMATFLDAEAPERLARKARYEIAVAELRGRGSLDPALPEIERFFDSLSPDCSPAELLDASVLCSYSFGARAHGQTSVSIETITNWVEHVRDLITAVLERKPIQGDRCTLLEARAMLGSIPHRREETKAGVRARIIQLWQDVISEVKNTPIFPVVYIADIFEVLTPVIGSHPQFRPLVDEIDRLVADRAGMQAAADLARRRALAHFDAGHRLLAIDELHRAKISWFTGETMEGSVLSMLTISECYFDLGLLAAARYYSAGALFIAMRSEDEQVKRRLARAALNLADTFHAAGEGITFFHSIQAALVAHDAVAIDPTDWSKHPQIQRTIAHAAIYRAIARRLAPELLPFIDGAIAAWPLPKQERDAFIALSEGEPWSTMPTDEIEATIARELGRHPFGDVGNRRFVEWSALGIRWSVRSAAERDTWFAALEVAAALQIVQVEFADLDLLVIPSVAIIDVELGDAEFPNIVQLPDNGRLAWRVVMPRSAAQPASFDHPAAMAVAILAQTTALPFDSFNELAAQRIQRGLPLRVFCVRPIRELMEFAQPESRELGQLHSKVRPSIQHPLKPTEADDLKWRDGPGPGYTAQRAKEHIRNRYEKTLACIRLTLPRLIEDHRCKCLINHLRKKGALDWQILAVLAAIVAQWQVQRQFGYALPPPDLARRMKERMFREERTDDPAFDLGQLTAERLELQEQLLTGAVFQTWDLAIHRDTPDFAAMKELLDQRYRHSTDDLPHEDPFPGLENEAE